jgi:hypothetical protein
MVFLKSPVIKDHYWRYLVNFWTAVTFIAVIYDFIKDNALEEFLGPILAIYISVLALYAGAKEFERWHHIHQSRHPGEYFVLGWTVLVAGLLLADLIFDKPYKLPGEMMSTYITVLGVLAITHKSKSFYKETHQRRK